MRRYRDWWLTVVAGLAALGVVVALIGWPLGGVFLTFATGAVFAAGMTLAAGIEDAGVRARAGRAALITGTALVAVGGLKMLLGPAVLAVLIVVGASSPPLLRLLRRFLTAAGPPKEPTAAAPETAEPHEEADTSPVAVDPPTASRPPDLQTLSDQQLCWAWRASFVALEQATTVSGRLSVVMARQSYLDELERRNAAGLSAWLTSGARAAGDPSRYIVRTHRQPPAA